MFFFLFILSIVAVFAQPIFATEQSTLLMDFRDGKKSVPRSERDSQDGWKLGRLDGVSLADVVTTFVDNRDGKKYKAVRIGTQVWMAENLNYEASDSKCYDNSSSNCDIYGRLYNWETALTVCPSGWHLPSYDEWDALSNYVQSNSGCSSCDASKLKATSGWYNNGNGTDAYGFSALPGGIGLSGGSFYDVGDGGFWWSATENGSDYAYRRYMYYILEDANWYYGYKSFLFSVRCLQDYGEAHH